MSRHLIVVAAGTGGHVMPGLAVAEALRARGWTVSWLGTRNGMEQQLVRGRGIEFDALDFASVRGKGLANWLFGGWRLLRALLASRAVLRRRRPAVVLATGGYIAVPAGLAAAWCRVPLALLNADVAPLLSSRLLRPLAAAVFCGFDGAAARWAGERGVVTGNPVRPEVAALAVPAQRFAGRSGPLRLLVLGGSLGAAVLNETVPAALARLPAERRPQVVHQCGSIHLAATRAAYAKAGVAGELTGFVEDVAAHYAWADVVLCRAGAITVTELTAAGVAAILVPFVASTTAHQVSNAEFLHEQGAAIHLPQAELSAARLAGMLSALTRPQLQSIAGLARELGRPRATAVVGAALAHLAEAGA